MRVSSDGHKYSKAQFLEFFGGTAEWEEALLISNQGLEYGLYQAGYWVCSVPCRNRAVMHS